MGIQSGSQEMLDFYKRPTPPARILKAGSVIASFSPKYHVPPAYDVITDNPIETRQNVVDTLELLYAMERPYTLLIYALKVIPNTGLEKAMRERGVDIDSIDSSYAVIPPSVGNLLLYILAICRPPRRMFDALLRRVEASGTPQKMYPRFGLILRTMYLSKRTLSHFRQMDFSVYPGVTGFIAWRIGLVGFWRRHMVRHLDRPTRQAPAERVPVAVAVDTEATSVNLIRKAR
jgi:hypothetical protein